MMDLKVDVVADLNAQDDDGMGGPSSPTLGTRTASVRAPCCLSETRTAGRLCASWLWMTTGQIHFSILPGSVEKNRHLLGRTAA